MHIKVTNLYTNLNGNQISTVQAITPPAVDAELSAILREAKMVAEKLAHYSETQLDLHPDQKLYGTEIVMQGIRVKGASNG